MCRFVAYLGKEPIILNKLLQDSSNSLICQSRLAKETKTGLNADGFGVGWYNRDIEEKPAVFRSVQPAWNDENLIHIASKVKSECFIGHVRAATVGEVSLANCHPFIHNEFLFAHNGSIHHFDQIKRDLILLMDDQHFNKIKGQTDSEYFFFLATHILKTRYEKATVETMAASLIDAIHTIDEILDQHGLEHDYRINAVLTNGKALAAVRYTSCEKNTPLSLYYSRQRDSVTIASECLTHLPHEWKEIPVNSILTIPEDFEIRIKEIQPPIPTR